MMLRATAFFSLVWPRVDAAQPRMILLTQYVPIEKRHMAKYLVGTFSVVKANMNPAIATNLERVICTVRSLKYPEE